MYRTYIPPRTEHAHVWRGRGLEWEEVEWESGIWNLESIVPDGGTALFTPVPFSSLSLQRAGAMGSDGCTGQEPKYIYLARIKTREHLELAGHQSDG